MEQSKTMETGGFAYLGYNNYSENYDFRNSCNYQKRAHPTDYFPIKAGLYVLN